MFGANDALDIRVKAIVQSGKIASKGIFFSSSEEVFDYMAKNNVKDIFFYKESICGLECVSTDVFDELFSLGKGSGKTTEESAFIYVPTEVTSGDKNYRITSSFGYVSQTDQHYVVISMLN